METRKEEYLSKRSAKELRDKGILDQFEVGTFEGLRSIVFIKIYFVKSIV